ncbi:MAG: hypothetical protein JWR37_1525 [Mycobacterium sp.]|nr:hypothetical protein [Mycobacterium sp.]MDT5366870.1 3-methylfumaryl-CoA hydratase [Mycobacterium sp.]
MSTTPAATLDAQVHGWSPGTIERVDQLDPGPAQSLHDLLGADPAPRDRGPVNSLCHWVYFQFWPRRSSLGPDGHPHAGGFLPPLLDRRRMFAGGRCTFYAPLHFSKPATANSWLAHRATKHGRSGELLLVTVGTTIAQNRRLCINEEQDFVYRSGPPRPPVARTGAVSADRFAPPVGGAVSCRQRTTFDPLTLFRFSALTANSHRIHYDEPYARDVEGHSGLLVHGPLLVLSMAEMMRGACAGELATFAYRLHRPVFSGESIDIVLAESDGAGQSSVRSAGGALAAMQATILDSAGALRATAEAHFEPESASRP